MRMTPRLTPRQRAFLDKLLELYRERRAPVHYSDIAERLGVNRFSAYDMLKVLEKKGLASSSYALRSAIVAAARGSSGPGRSMVVFSPTPQAASLLGVRGEDDRPGEEWRKVRALVLRKLRSARDANVREALDDLLARLPDAGAPLNFCTEMIGVLLLNMQRAKTRVGGLNPLRAIAAFQVNGDAGLETLAGLSVGTTLLADDEAEPSLSQRLLDHARRYQSSLLRLSGEARTALVQFLDEALRALD
jgi:DNA-binding MarR family transcriptional regulator